MAKFLLTLCVSAKVAAQGQMQITVMGVVPPEGVRLGTKVGNVSATLTFKVGTNDEAPAVFRMSDTHAIWQQHQSPDQQAGWLRLYNHLRKQAGATLTREAEVEFSGAVAGSGPTVADELV